MKYLNFISVDFRFFKESDKLGSKMRRSVTLGVSALLLGGCAIPVPLQIASWALDGISMLATQKSVTDHGISIVTQKDCAVWRGFTEGEICREHGPSDVLIAEDTVRMPTSTGLTQTASFGPRVANLSPSPSITQSAVRSQSVFASPKVQVRAVPAHAVRAAWAEKLRPVTKINIAPVGAAVKPALRKEAQLAAVKISAKPSLAPKPELKPIQVASVAVSTPVKTKTAAVEPTKGIYFVIGSFRNPENAQRLVSGNGKLMPAVLSARLDGTEVYRVVVGPVPRGREKRLHRALAGDGFPDTWAIRINPSDWRFAKLPKPHSKISPELATLQK